MGRLIASAAAADFVFAVREGSVLRLGVAYSLVCMGAQMACSRRAHAVVIGSIGAATLREGVIQPESH